MQVKSDKKKKKKKTTLHSCESHPLADHEYSLPRDSAKVTFMFTVYKKFWRVVLIYTNWRHWYFGPHGADKEKGFQFVMGNTSLLILNFGCSQRISKYYQRKWTPFVSHMGTVDFQSLRGSVSHCFFLPIQSGISLKEKNHKNSSASCPCAPSAFGTETVGAHG